MFAALMTTPSANRQSRTDAGRAEAMLGKRHEPFRAGPEREKYADAYETRFAPSLRSWPSPARARSGRSSGSAVRSHSGRGTVSQSRKPTPLML